MGNCSCSGNDDVISGIIENDVLEPEASDEIIIRRVAFDGAVGPGGKTTGGKGGAQYYVTSRNDNDGRRITGINIRNPARETHPAETVTIGASVHFTRDNVEMNHQVNAQQGCFREFLTHRNRRDINFGVSGIMYLLSPIYCTQYNGNVSIDGRIQSSRAACLAGGTVVFTGTQDIILRYMSFRGVNLVFSQCSHVIIDHCDFSFGSLVITNSEAITIQWNKFDEQKITLDNPYNVLSFYNLFLNCITNVSRTNFVNCSFVNTMSRHYMPISVISGPVRVLYSIFNGYEAIDANVNGTENVTILPERETNTDVEMEKMSEILRDELDPNTLDCDLIAYVKNPVDAHNSIIEFAGSNPNKIMPVPHSELRSKVLPLRKSKSVFPAEFVEMIKL